MWKFMAMASCWSWLAIQGRCSNRMLLHLATSCLVVPQTVHVIYRHVQYIQHIRPCSVRGWLQWSLVGLLGHVRDWLIERLAKAVEGSGLARRTHRLRGDWGPIGVHPTSLSAWGSWCRIICRCTVMLAKVVAPQGVASPVYTWGV